MILALTSTTAEMRDIYDAADSIIGQKLSQVPGIGQANVGGGAKPAVRVQLNTTQLNKYGLGSDTVRTVLNLANAIGPKGQLADDTKAWEISTTDQLHKAAEYRPIVVAYVNGAPVRLQDIAEVEDSVEDRRNAGYYNGTPAVLVTLFKQPGANIIETVDRVYALLPLLQASIPQNIHLAVSMDQDYNHPRLGAERYRVDPAPLGLPRDHGGLCLSSELLGHCDSEHLGAAFLARHHRHHVFDRLQPRQSVPDGSHHLNRVRCGRCDRRHRKYHSLSGTSGMAPIDAALKGARGELVSTGNFHERFADRGLHPDPAYGWHRGPPVPRICRYPWLWQSQSAMVVSLTTTTMMCAKFLKSQHGRKHNWAYRVGERGFEKLLGGYATTLLRWAVLRHQQVTITVLLITIGFNVYL